MMTRSLQLFLVILLASSLVLATTEPNQPASATQEMRKLFEMDRRLDEQYAGMSYPPRGDVESLPQRGDVEPAPRRGDVEPAPQRGDVVPGASYEYDEAEEEARQAAEFERMINLLEKEAARRDPTFTNGRSPGGSEQMVTTTNRPTTDSDDKITTESEEATTLKSEMITSTTPVQVSSKSDEATTLKSIITASPSTTTKPATTKSVSTSEADFTEDEAARQTAEFKTTVSQLKATLKPKSSAAPKLRRKFKVKAPARSQSESYRLDASETRPNATVSAYLKIKTALDTTSQSKDNVTPSNGVEGQTTLTTSTVEPPKVDLAGNSSMWIALLPAIIVFLICVTTAVLAGLLYFLCRDPPKEQALDGKDKKSRFSKVIGLDRRMRREANDSKKEISPDQQFCSKGNYYVPNIVDQMPTNPFNDKNVYTNPKAEKLVRDATGRGNSLTPINVQNVDYDQFSSKMLDDETALKTPVGLGEDGEGDLSSGSQLRFVSIPLDGDVTAKSPEDGVRVGHVTHVCHI